MTSEKTFDLILMAGVGGDSVYLNDYRIAGPKPWGGGKPKAVWKISARDLASALGAEFIADFPPRIERQGICARPQAFGGKK